MNKALTKREKRMLYLLLCFLIVVGGVYLLVLPALERYQTAQDNHQQQANQRQTIEAAIAELPALQDQLSQAQEAASANSNRFYGYLEPEQLDRLLIGLATANHLLPVSLSVQEPQTTELTTFGEEVSSVPAANNGSDGTSSQIDRNKLLSSIVNLQLNGSRADMQSFLDVLSQMDSLRVNGISTEGENYNLIVEVFMLEELE